MSRGSDGSSCACLTGSCLPLCNRFPRYNSMSNICTCTFMCKDVDLHYIVQ